VTSTKEAIHEVIDELKAEAYAVGSGAADGKGFSNANDLLRFAVAETLSIGRAASDGVSLCLELVNHFAVKRSHPK
jgi:7-keto-8-aminopelargonate synthetase-like enzyme